MRGKQPFLTRLGRDTRGNTIALVAAAMLPLAGMIGGGVDMSRLYLVKTRLQQACDAGALAGRKEMATGAWTTGTNNGSAEDRAKKLFNANFVEGAYGTGALAKAFTEDDGTVSGSASVTVPMTIMRIFGMTERTLSVSCTAKMEIPNTDVMFVLDVTGSMSSGNKIGGLKSAVKCFYEALLRVNTTEDCGNDPTATSYSGSAQIRIGFVPYSVNVNVGKLLQNDWLADEWDYQSREAKTTPVQTWTAGAEGPRSSWSGWTPSTTPSTYNSTSGFGSFSSVGSDVTIDGTTYLRRPSGMSSSTCPGLNNLPNSGGTLVARADVSTSSSTNSSSAAPVYPATSQTVTYTDTDGRSVTAYRYRWTSNRCQLESASRSYNRERTATATQAIEWKEYQRFDNWAYRKITHDISGLKAGDSNWNGSVALPLTTTSSPTVKLSGSNASTTLTLVADSTVTWDGCIEERQTVPTNSTNPTNEWTPIPAAAYDLDIDMIPDASKPTSYWGPVLNGAVWGRYTGSSTSNRTTNTVTTSNNLSRNTSYSCATEAKKLQTWYTSGSFESYVNSLTPQGNTYHDIGMIWGARFISPTGIFASENAQTPTGGAIQRHIVFMTDGDTQTGINNLTAYGIPWWDRRQTNYTPTAGNLDNILNARLAALCTAIKNRNTVLWVVSYGGGTTASTETRLRTCASAGKYFSAADTPTLISNFKQIAAEIAELRLIN